MSKEIGSEFWDVPTCQRENVLFPKNTSWFLSGRSALLSIISDIKSKGVFRTVAIPSWCCDSMILPFINNGIEVSFYPVYFKDGLVQDFSGIKSDVVLVMDYFGYTGTSSIKGYEGVIIRDVTHSIFSARYNDADYYFGSLRKWAGFWTGGYAWPVKKQEKVDEKYTMLRKVAMEEKSEYVLGLSESKGFLTLFDKAEEYLENCGVANANSRDIELAQKLDIKTVKNQRRKNASVLLDEIKDMAIFPVIKETDCPMFVPILVPEGKRNQLSQYLIERKIYCPVHWPVSKYHTLTDGAMTVYENELSIVCDHRYTEKDMGRIIETIKDFWKGV